MMRSTGLRLIPATALVVVALAACAPEGSLDAARVAVKVNGSSLTVAGWALDQDRPSAPIDVHVYIDGNGVATRADKPRPDVAAAKSGAGPNHGFSVTVDVAVGAHEVCAYGINLPGTLGENRLLGCKTVSVHPPVTTAPPTTAKAAPTKVAPTTTTTTTAPPSAPTTWQADLVKRINSSRAADGVAEVAACPALATTAQAYAKTMASNSWFDQTGPDGSDPWTRQDGYAGTSAGENISFGYDSTSALHESQMASAEQSATLLQPEFTHVGVGRALGDPDGSGPEPAGYYWVVELGASGTC